MTYQETLDYLFNALPMFQRIGAAAFKKDLGKTIQLCNHLGNPQKHFKSIHVAGTNGKGSTSHAIASVLQEAGYKVGLYTSPHLKSFTERIKINGKEIAEEKVIEFVSAHKNYLDTLKPSFFEMTVGLAFYYFNAERVDYAVVEVGMGGRFDSTNILHPLVTVITNIGLDHTQFLGDSLEKIAFEKAGIIKENIPVVISQSQMETKAVFDQVAKEKKADIFYADKSYQTQQIGLNGVSKLCDYKVVKGGLSFVLAMDLFGKYQEKNLPGILLALDLLKQQDVDIPDQAIQEGLAKTSVQTGLKGRFQKLSEDPMIYCDTGHNAEGISSIMEQLEHMQFNQLHIIIGMVNDKDIHKVLALLPQNAQYTFCQAAIPRAMDANLLQEEAKSFGLKGEVVKDVNEALEKALKKADKKDLIFVGGSTFVVAELENL